MENICPHIGSRFNFAGTNKLEENGVEENLESVNAENSQNQSTEESQLVEVLQRLAQAETLIMHQKDEVLRVQAEMQNLRRRTELDVEKAHKFGQEKLSSELLGVMDNLERAIQVSTDKENESVKVLLQGVELTLKSFVDCFRKFSIEQIDPLGEPFDPQQHQAMVMQENPNAEPGTVTAVMQKGYALHGRVIRPAMVVVAKAPAGSIDERV
ncbi:MAG: nucleotide exchange factor GrpE [Gammaproteobacteria bacterium]|nr:nucleotide exchange factor GrpE [Gammaproteobacteria bacterium]MDO9317750.1 nucleotide exchange factor GrpE [Gammaproteobacteria bacterium]